MARGLNKIQLIGNLGAKPEIESNNEQTPRTSFPVATTESWQDRNSGERKENTEWHRVKAFGPRAQFAANYLDKGARVYVEGRVQNESWTDNDGNERRRTVVVARDILPLDQAATRDNADDAAAEDVAAEDDIPF